MCQLVSVRSRLWNNGVVEITCSPCIVLLADLLDSSADLRSVDSCSALDKPAAVTGQDWGIRGFETDPWLWITGFRLGRFLLCLLNVISTFYLRSMAAHTAQSGLRTLSVSPVAACLLNASSCVHPQKSNLSFSHRADINIKTSCNTRTFLQFMDYSVCKACSWHLCAFISSASLFIQRMYLHLHCCSVGNGYTWISGFVEVAACILNDL